MLNLLRYCVNNYIIISKLDIIQLVVSYLNKTY